MRILLDQNVPHGLRRYLRRHETFTVAYLGWEHLRNGELIAVAEAGDFDLLITGDKNLRYQQNLEDRQLAIIILGSTRWDLVQARSAEIVRAAEAIERSVLVELRFANEA